ncbi:L-rhamnose/proton symporter RhaT [uncultured Paludibaculum sp.]|uniref:L-rhamnose/proton symporter RhaT n=1 Tax=uncultured Paludibaculum sp. TaxID=1765020 RepID=UPI002AAB3AE0|nr:L-rhamnose/proton symporter RhaT [uncultured Paludibaculum sp.]
MNSIVSAIGWHMVGAASAASFYAPIGKVKKWSWETTWAVAGIFSWVLLPIAVSFFLLPDFRAFYAALDSSVVLKAFLFGCMWGVGNVNYGLTMRYLGMSLGIGIAIGTTLVVGTLLPPFLHGQFLFLFTSNNGLVTLAGILVALVGVAVVTYAGHQKEEQLGVTAAEFDLKKGLLLALMCGFFSSGMSFAIDASKPIEQAALQLGVDPLYAALPSYVIIMGGGALVNFAYCIGRLALKSDLSFRADCSQSMSVNLRNGLLAATGGTMWYLQFFFYAWGAANIPQNLSYVNWMLHMSGYVLFGGLVGLALGEWARVNRRPIVILWIGMLIIIVAANLVGLGMAI